MYPGPRHTSLQGRVLNLRRLLNEYRWELWLFIGIPSVAATVGPIGLAYTWDVIASDDGWFFSAWRAFSTSVVAAVLLGASYAKVRRLEGFMLKLFWRYSLAASVVSALGFLTISLLPSQPWDPFGLGLVAFYLRGVLSTSCAGRCSVASCDYGSPERPRGSAWRTPSWSLRYRGSTAGSPILHLPICPRGLDAGPSPLWTRPMSHVPVRHRSPRNCDHRVVGLGARELRRSWVFDRVDVRL